MKSFPDLELNGPLDYLNSVASECDANGKHDGCVQRLAMTILEEDGFLICSGSSQPTQHHYGNYGLITHTAEVVQTCMTMRSLYPQYDIDETELYLAALYHDVGKIYDYGINKTVKHDEDGNSYTVESWGGTDHKRYIHHVSRSAIVWSKSIDRLRIENGAFVETYEQSVLHAILAHHGQREWGSPVAPKSRVAWLLHLSDGISARLYDADTLDVVKR